MQISSTAWPSIAAALHKYEILRVTVLDKPLSPVPRPQTIAESAEAPPQYSTNQQFLNVDEHKYGALDRSPSHSPSPSRSPPRTPPRSPSPSIGHRLKNWITRDSEQQ